MKMINNLPRKWGEGAYFAFSGLDGASDWESHFAGTLVSDRLGMLFHTEVRRELWFDCSPADLDYQVVASDLIEAVPKTNNGSLDGRITILFYDAFTVLGRTHCCAVPRVSVEQGVETQCGDRILIQSDGSEYTALVMEPDGDAIRFAFAYSKSSADEALDKARRISDIDIELEIEKKKRFFEALPSPGLTDPLLERTYYKAFSVLKGDVMSPEGALRHKWVVPDRVPHRDIWLWDTIFLALALKYYSPDVAYETIRAMFDVQRDDGFMAHRSSPRGPVSNITQPPLNAWGLWGLYEFTERLELLDETYDDLDRYLRWNTSNRAGSREGLFEWRHRDESGLDNSPRFDETIEFDAVDFSCYMANEARHMSRFAAKLGKTSDSAVWTDIYHSIREAVNTHLWDPVDGVYYDKRGDGRFIKVLTNSAFLPLFAGVCDQDRARRLVDLLADPRHFNTPLPVPSVSVSEATYSSDMWRGPVWLNVNYMIYRGLKDYGYDEAAARIRTVTLREVSSRYDADGVIFEFYDPMLQLPPHTMDRKGKAVETYDFRGRLPNTRDLGWSCAAFICFCMENGARQAAERLSASARRTEPSAARDT